MFKRVLTLLIVFTMYFNAGMVPNFLLVKNLGMYNSMWALVLPGAVSTWNLIVMKTAFASVPVSLEESARLDGANDFVILGKIFLPLSKATVAVMILFYAVGHWSSWFNAMIYLQDRNQISTAADYAGNPDFQFDERKFDGGYGRDVFTGGCKICDDRCFDRSGAVYLSIRTEIFYDRRDDGIGKRVKK